MRSLLTELRAIASVASLQKDVASTGAWIGLMEESMKATFALLAPLREADPGAAGGTGESIRHSAREATSLPRPEPASLA